MAKPFLYSVVIALLFLSSCKKEDVVVKKDYQTLGTAAHDFLSADTYQSLTVEISYMPGYAPDANTVNTLKSFLSTWLNKPNGVTVNSKQISSQGKSIYTLTEIANLEKQVRTVFTNGTNLTAHVLVLDADYEKDKILGTSYWNTSMSLFGKTFYASSGGLNQVSRSQLYTTLLEHEFGHLFGLVSQGTPMVTPHNDPANGAHCNNNKCLMYYAIETGTAQNGIPVFDANCQADLRANGGK
jgi:hypothetical protein